ncbi:hypothetical protein J4437_06990 [Candidatus Woesearchaeota archaeon]|nr:hypothetical protein [Candidatus Woesearchaeota archaeon]
MKSIWILIWTVLHTISIRVLLYFSKLIEINNHFIELLFIGFGVTILANIYRTFNGKKFIVNSIFIFWVAINTFSIWLFLDLINSWLNIENILVISIIMGLILVITSYAVHFLNLLNLRGLKIFVPTITIFIFLFFMSNSFNPISNNDNIISESSDYQDKISSIKEDIKVKVDEIKENLDQNSEKNIQKREEESKVESQEAFAYLNTLRSENGLPQLKWDDRVYDLGIERTKDMDEYRYLDHTNPVTGECPDKIKQRFGLSPREYVAENAYGMYGANALPREAIDSWMTSRGHKYNLLYPTHIAGAVSCYEGYCVFLGLNIDRFGEGCFTGAEGISFWNSVTKQPGER